MRRKVPRLALALAVLSTLPGCRGCKNEHPFVPYRIDDGGGGATASSEASAVSSAALASALMPQPAVVAPPHATSWTLGTMLLAAPAGATFRQGLTWDVDGDGHDDALVLVETVEESVREELLFFRGSAEGAPSAVRVPLVSGPPPLLDPRCERVELLRRVGKRSAAVEIGQTCPKPVASVGPDRAVALVAWSGALRPRVSFEVDDPPDAPTLAFDLDGADVDGDGLDDVTLRVALSGGGPPFEPVKPVHATFRWFDRPAGMSRDPGEPEKSFHTIAAAALPRAAKPKDAASALELAAAGRFLFQAVCSESTGRRVAPSPGTSPLVCDAGRSLEELGLAETRAEVTLADTLRAIAALDAAERPPAARSPARVSEAVGWITAMAPAVQATQMRAVSAVPFVGPEGASWGALRFEPSGNLLVRTPVGVVRVDPVHGDETDATGVAAWGTKVLAPDGKMRLDGAFVSCRSLALQATLATSVGGDAASVALPVPSPVVARCGAGDREPVATLPVAWGPDGLELVVQGEPVLIVPSGEKASPLSQPLAQPVNPGAPRSPDGTVLVVPTSQGIVVRGQRTRLFRAKELEHGYGELRDCTVSDDGARVACVRGGVAFVGLWPPS